MTIKEYLLGAGMIKPENIDEFLEKACCFVSQRYWKMKAIHNSATDFYKS